jgi:hypothetical protein
VIHLDVVAAVQGVDEARAVDLLGRSVAGKLTVSTPGAGAMVYVGVAATRLRGSRCR